LLIAEGRNSYTQVNKRYFDRMYTIVGDSNNTERDFKKHEGRLFSTGAT